MNEQIFDLAIIGGGINGCGIARDAAGRGLRVLLVEQHDLASATSGWSTKLIHGGLRYLEHYEFRLVRESLQEREVLMRLAPHIIHPLRFVLPHARNMRPAWMIRAGLFLYDRLGGKSSLPRSQSVRFPHTSFSATLQGAFTQGFVYADACVDDARLTLFNAMSAEALGAHIATRCKFMRAARQDGIWQLQLTCSSTGATNTPETQTMRARALINAAGPWVKDVIDQRIDDAAATQPAASVRLVKGSHIVVPRLHAGEHAMILQNDDGRVTFVIPYEDAYTLIGTTDVVVTNINAARDISEDEIHYLLRAVNRYLSKAVQRSDVVWHYAGVRPLYDDGKSDPAAITRDYVLKRSDDNGNAPLLSIYGGKITTYRRLAEHALAELRPYFPAMGADWTATTPLPGGDFNDGEDVAEFTRNLQREYLRLPPDYIARLVLRHGTNARLVLRNVRSVDDLGALFGRGRHMLCEREIEYMIAHEWAQSAEDILWRRTKCGLHMDADERARAAEFIQQKLTLKPA